MLEFHKRRNEILTMGLFKTNFPEQCGIVELDEDNLVTSFVEKPESPKSNLANAGIYIATPQLLKYVPQKEPADLGYDVFPQLINKIYGYIIQEYLLDIGTWENYQKAQQEWKG